MNDTAHQPDARSGLGEAAAWYAELRRTLRRIVNRAVPTGARLLVVSDGDDDLLRLGLREAGHFPQIEDGTHAGFQPADDAEAIAHLEELHRAGAQFLLFPATAFWWLEHYTGFRGHLETQYRRSWADEHCIVFELGSAPGTDRAPRSGARRGEAAAQTRQPAPTSGMVDIDVAGTRLQERFFTAFPIDSLEELRDLLLEAPDLDSFVELPGADNIGYSGWAYWFFYLRGYLEYVESRAIGTDNSYYEFLRRYFVPRARDRGLAEELVNPLTAIERIARRFRDLDFYHHPGRNNPVGLYGPPPAKLIVSDPPAEDAMSIYVWGADEPVRVKQLDGHHRLFAARLFGCVEFRGEVIPEPKDLPAVRGVVEELRFDGERLEIRGWCIHPRLKVESFEVRHGGATIAQVGVEGRADVADRFTAVPHAFRSGFAVDAKCRRPVGEPARFEVVPRSDWLPIGVLVAPYLPGMYDSGAAPREALRAVKVLDGMLAPLARHRPLETLAAVIVCETPLPLERFVPRLLPAAEIVAAEADLVLAYSVLPPLTPGDEDKWLRRTHGLLRPGGYVVASVLGELVRPFLGSGLGRLLDEKGVAREGRLIHRTKEHTIEECSRWFEVVEYLEGGVDDREDLVVLRRA